jgi:hypothetical protein
MVAMVAVISAGCSNAPAGTGSSGGNSIAATREKAVKFAECMRDNGVSEFPRPVGAAGPNVCNGDGFRPARGSPLI